jgi:hypothetical protein
MACGKILLRITVSEERVMYKTCIECRKEKMARLSFHKDKTRKDGLCVICKECMRERHLKYYVPKLVKAGGECDICQTKRKVYRDHQGGGRLCRRCLTVKGLVASSVKILDNLADYIEGK